MPFKFKLRKPKGRHAPASAPVAAVAPHPRVCACVLMNHPFPANLPLLRRIYRERFSEVRFLIPFERMADEDVITVYRGSYTHATYLTDAHHVLAQIDCDYFVVVHDDVLLNPRISEATFEETFGLGPDDGFIARVYPAPAQVDQSAWWFGTLPKLLYPKSLVFGSGVEPANLLKYLPSAATLGERMHAQAVAPRTATRFDPDEIRVGAMGHLMSRLMMHGFIAPHFDAATLAKLDLASAQAARNLVQMMLEERRAIGAAGGDFDDTVALPLPMLNSIYYTDFYILPKSGFDDFCHFIGVAGAANLFVEIMVPTLLYACCDKVVLAADADLDFSGFDRPRTLDWFEERRAAGLHPIKLSAFREPAAQDALMDVLDALGRGEPVPPDAVARAGFDSRLAHFLDPGPGWHEREREIHDVWSSGSDAVIPIRLAGPAAVALTLRAPLHAARPIQSGTISYNGGAGAQRFASSETSADVRLIVDRLEPDADGVARIRLASDQFVCACDHDPSSVDRRKLGFGFVAGTLIVVPGDPLRALSLTACPGWHQFEGWGYWSATPEATIPIALDGPAPVRLTLRAPLHSFVPHQTATIRFNGDRQELRLGSGPSAADVTLTIDRLEPDADGIARIRLITDRMLRPCDLDPATPDGRALGFGYVAGSLVASPAGPSVREAAA